MDAFGDLSVLFIAYVRPQPDWLESYYAQLIQGTLPMKWVRTNFVDHMIDSSTHLRWEQLIRTVTGAVGPDNVEFRPYLGRLTVTDFFSRIGWPVPESHVLMNDVNTAISLERQVIARDIKKTIEPSHLPTLSRLVRTTPPTDTRQSKRSPFSEEEQLRIITEFEPDWRAITPQLALSSGMTEQSVLDIWTSSTRDRPRPQGPTSVSDPAVIDDMLALIRGLIAIENQREVEANRPRSRSYYLATQPHKLGAHYLRQLRRATFG